MTPDFPTAPSAYGLEGPSATVTVEKSLHASHTEILIPPTVLVWLRKHGRQNWGPMAHYGRMSEPSQSTHSQTLTPEQRIKELEVQLKEAREKSQFFEAVIDVLKKDYGVRVVKKPVGKSLRKSPSRG